METIQPEMPMPQYRSAQGPIVLEKIAFFGPQSVISGRAREAIIAARSRCLRSELRELEKIPEIRQLMDGQSEFPSQALSIAQLHDEHGKTLYHLLLVRSGFWIVREDEVHNLLRRTPFFPFISTSALMPFVESGLTLERVIDTLRKAKPDWITGQSLVLLQSSLKR